MEHPVKIMGPFDFSHSKITKIQTIVVIQLMFLPLSLLALNSQIFTVLINTFSRFQVAPMHQIFFVTLLQKNPKKVRLNCFRTRSLHRAEFWNNKIILSCAASFYPNLKFVILKMIKNDLVPW